VHDSGAGDENAKISGETKGHLKEKGHAKKHGPGAIAERRQPPWQAA